MGSIKALRQLWILLDSGKFELEISKDIKEEIEEYRKKQSGISRIYFAKKGLESKTI